MLGACTHNFFPLPSCHQLESHCFLRCYETLLERTYQFAIDFYHLKNLEAAASQSHNISLSSKQPVDEDNPPGTSPYVIDAFWVGNVRSVRIFCEWQLLNVHIF